MRDEWREDYDEGRGGWGAKMQEQEMREQQVKDVYSSFHLPQGASQDYYGHESGYSKRGREDEYESFGYSKSRRRSRSPDE